MEMTCNFVIKTVSFLYEIKTSGLIMAKKKKTIFNLFSNANRRDDNGRTELYKAAKAGNVQKVKSCIKSGTDPDIPNFQGLTPLHQAAYWGEVEIVKELLAAGADPNADNGRGWTPLHSAALAAGLDRRAEVIKLLIDAGCDCKTPDNYGWSAEDYMRLWIEHDDKNLEKMRKVFQDESFLDKTQQPDMDKLGVKKDNKQPPSHAKSNDAANDDSDIADLLRRIEDRSAEKRKESGSAMKRPGKDESEIEDLLRRIDEKNPPASSGKSGAAKRNNPKP
ncbi:MAG: ankyrin repeat domain-containing protein [Proteobacteria bacterium]|nr:ankyrin repeat domain-containing protein [Pseudomonadota bacterium]